MRHRFGRPLDAVARHRLVPRAREMRLHPEPSERKLWSCIRSGQLGVRFRRQVIIGPYVLDFFAPSVGLVVEVDGGVHRTHVHNDRLRDEALRARGLRVLRLDAELVECCIEAVVSEIRLALVGVQRLA